MVIEVKQYHIRKARKDCKTQFTAMACPIAQAIRSLLPDSRITVAFRHATVDGEMFVLPRRAQQLITNFDSERPVKPMRFRIDGLTRH